MTDEQQCGTQRRMTGVLITCHRVRGHNGPHASSSYGVRWRDTGEVLPPPAPGAHASRSANPKAAPSGPITQGHMVSNR